MDLISDLNKAAVLLPTKASVIQYIVSRLEKYPAAVIDVNTDALHAFARNQTFEEKRRKNDAIKIIDVLNVITGLPNFGVDNVYTQLATKLDRIAKIPMLQPYLDACNKTKNLLKKWESLHFPPDGDQSTINLNELFTTESINYEKYQKLLDWIQQHNTS